MFSKYVEQRRFSETSVNMLINFVRSFVTFVTFNLATGPMLSCDAILFGKGFGGPKLPHLVVKPGALFGKGGTTISPEVDTLLALSSSIF